MPAKFEVGQKVLFKCRRKSRLDGKTRFVQMGGTISDDAAPNLWRIVGYGFVAEVLKDDPTLEHNTLFSQRAPFWPLKNPK